jgi:3-oxoacyl-[acyl-carrier protein] reductase
VDLGLQDSVCLVTGSTGGIGLALAELLRAEGAQVVTTGRTSGDVQADLGRPGEPERLVRETEERYGRIDVLVNNVGLAFQRSFEEVTDEQWDELWQLNVMSYVRTIRAVLPGMKERGAGVIVNVSSTAGKRPSGSMPDY